VFLDILSYMYSRKQEREKKGRSHMCYINVIRASWIFPKPISNLTILGARRVT
jgi:hypothetical protein